MRDKFKECQCTSGDAIWDSDIVWHTLNRRHFLLHTIKAEKRFSETVPINPMEATN